MRIGGGGNEAGRLEWRVVSTGKVCDEAGSSGVSCGEAGRLWCGKAECGKDGQAKGGEWKKTEGKKRKRERGEKVKGGRKGREVGQRDQEGGRRGRSERRHV